MDAKDIIRLRRKELGLTMKDVAEYVGVSEGTVSRWEKGEIANMRRSRINSLSKILQIDPTILIITDPPSDKLKTHLDEVVFIGDSSYTETSSKKGEYCEKLSRIVDRISVDELKQLVDVATIMFEK